jgi:hypothetical protein
LIEVELSFYEITTAIFYTISPIRFDDLRHRPTVFKNRLLKAAWKQQEFFEDSYAVARALVDKSQELELEARMRQLRDDEAKWSEILVGKKFQLKQKRPKMSHSHEVADPNVGY